MSNIKSYETIADAKLLAGDILAKSLDATVGCTLIASIAAKLHYPESLEVFSALAHDQSGHEQFGISAADCVDDVFEACHALLRGSDKNCHDV